LWRKKYIQSTGRLARLYSREHGRGHATQQEDKKLTNKKRSSTRSNAHRCETFFRSLGRALIGYPFDRTGTTIQETRYKDIRNYYGHFEEDRSGHRSELILERRACEGGRETRWIRVSRTYQHKRSKKLLVIGRRRKKANTGPEKGTRGKKTEKTGIVRLRA
jgi:hypothetical protein